MNKSKIINGFIIGTFVSLYILVSVVSTIHVIDFFELSNPYWLAVTLAIGFELGAAASLAALITLDKMNKSLVWALFITITAMQMQGNMYYAFISLEEYTGWVELFNLVEWEPLAQKRLLAAVSGAILPLVALGFIKSLVDYIKPESEVGELSTTNLEEATKDINDSEKKTNIVSDDTQIVDPKEIPFSEEELNNMATFTKKDVETMVEANDNPKEPNDALKNAVRPAKHEPVKKVGLTQQVKEARVVKPANITRSTQPDNGLSALVQRTSKTQPGEN
tara:strand:- start:3309 stop:4142 length:834 start_codon:yes stop_codon:yes gene_type:complete